MELFVEFNVKGNYHGYVIIISNKIKFKFFEVKWSDVMRSVDTISIKFHFPKKQHEKKNKKQQQQQQRIFFLSVKMTNCSSTFFWVSFNHFPQSGFDKLHIFATLTLYKCHAMTNWDTHAWRVRSLPSGVNSNICLVNRFAFTYNHKYMNPFSAHTTERDYNRNM